MDSQDFRRTVWPDATREQSDVALTAALLWVGKWAVPERVYNRQQLEAWALRNGYVQRDDADLIMLLREAQAYVVRGTPLAVAINDAIVARRSVA